MAKLVNLRKSGAMVVLELNRPEAINALNLDMIEELRFALHECEMADHVRLVVLQGVGERGFCAGGDVRAIRELVLHGKQEKAERFFEAEYALNREIAHCTTPVISLMHGVVMGGGIGLASHAHVRLARSDCRLAMPEGKIGLFPDVGVRALMRKIPKQAALLFLLSGEIVGARDGVNLNLADFEVRTSDWGEVPEMLEKASQSGDVIAELRRLGERLDATVIDADEGKDGKPSFFERAKAVPDISDMGAREFLANVRNSEWRETRFGAFANVISKVCFASSAATLMGMADIGPETHLVDVLDQDLALAKLMIGRTDFAEGVRSVLVDKSYDAQFDELADGPSQEQLISQLDQTISKA